MITAMRFAEDLEIFKKEAPFELFGYPMGTSNRITNCQYTTVEGIQVKDARADPAAFSLETTGFQYIHHRSKCPLKAQYFEKVGSSLDDNPVVVEYLKESIDLAKRELGVAEVICFDWRVRSDCLPYFCASPP